VRCNKDLKCVSWRVGEEKVRIHNLFCSLPKNVQELKNRSTKEIAVMAIYLRVLLKRTSLFVSQKFSSFLSSLASVKNRTSPTIH
jgi:hypothetical protein